MFDGDRRLAPEAAIWHVGSLCHAAADGRRAARALAQWCECFELGESEFQILWCLRESVANGFDQTTLVKRLAFSPAQVSATVERLRNRGWIVQQPTAGDRRRNRWYLSAVGSGVLRAMLQAAHELRPDSPYDVERVVPIAQRQEAA